MEPPMSRYWSKLINRLTPYVPGEQPQQAQLIKLNTNESPYDPSPAVLEAIASVSATQLRLYPEPESASLRQAFAEMNDLVPEQVFLGNGSDEVLAHVFQALLCHNKSVCFPDVSYSFYPVWCDLYSLPYELVPLAEDFTVDINTYPVDNGGIIIPNPNAPTGILLGLNEIRELLEINSESVVVIDEAYIDFGGESAVGLIDQYDNLLVVQTVSKSRALAGLRVGVAMGHRDLIEGLERLKNSFNSYPLDVLAQNATLASLQDVEYFDKACGRVIASREKLTAEMEAMGFDVLPSKANFIFATHPGQDAKKLFDDLRAKNILVRHFDKPRTRDYLRISIGTPGQCDAVVSALCELLAI
jgi:histidinol-phosphate aminotransferase